MNYYNFDNIKKYSKTILNKIKVTSEYVLDIKADSIVNMANEALMGGGGMDMLIHTYAGDSLKMETSELKTIEKIGTYEVKCLTGDAKITSGHNLPYKYILHTVTPYLDTVGKPNKEKHIKCYNSCLKYIDGINIRSMIFPPLSTGYYGYPMLEATILALMTILNFVEIHHDKIDNIYIWLHNDVLYSMYNYILDKMSI